jgi:predicted dehydrogenase
MEMTRREFNRLVALGTGVELLPRIPFAPEGRKIGYCIVGLGRISMQHFMPAVKMSNKSRIKALVSGHRDKAELMAAEYGVPSGSIYNYENYDEIAKNPAIDAVYVALPNSMHADYTIRAAEAGKHVLCEKPMATSVEESRAMIQASESAGRKLMIAYRCQYEPAHLRAVQLIRGGSLARSNPWRARLVSPSRQTNGASTRNYPAGVRWWTWEFIASMPAVISLVRNPTK